MKIGEIMTRQVECISPHTTISQAATKMRDLDVGFLPVCEKDRLVGTLTDRDITVRSVAQGRDPRLAPIQEIMTLEVFTCFEDEDIEAVSKYMEDNEVRRMVILDRNHRLAGVVSIGDLARASGDAELAGETLGHIVDAA